MHNDFLISFLLALIPIFTLSSVSTLWYISTFYVSIFLFFFSIIFSNFTLLNATTTDEAMWYADEVIDTAELCLIFDKLFDSVNSSLCSIKNGKKYRVALSRNLPHLKLWDEMEMIIQSIHFVNHKNKQTTPPSLKNWLITLRSLKNIWTDLNENHNFNILFLRNFNQDPLEKFFGSIRSHGVRNIMPTCTSFETSFKTLLITNLTSSYSIGSNCENNDSGGCLSSLKSLIEHPNSLIINNNSDQENLELIEKNNRILQKRCLRENKISSQC